MTTTKHTLADGTKLETASGRRYVTFIIRADRIEVDKRTDDLTVARKNHDKATRSSRVVTVDMQEQAVIADRAARVLDDLDRRMAEMNAQIRADNEARRAR